MAWGTWTERGLSLRRCDDILRSMRSELVLSDDMGMRSSMRASYNYDSESVNTQWPDESSIKSCTVHWAWLPFFQLIVPHPLALPSLHTFWCGGCKQMLQQLRRCHWWKCDWRRCNHTRRWSRRCPWRRSWRSPWRCSRWCLRWCTRWCAWPSAWKVDRESPRRPEYGSLIEDAQKWWHMRERQRQVHWQWQENPCRPGAPRNYLHTLGDAGPDVICKSFKAVNWQTTGWQLSPAKGLPWISF